jgi:hypothetical protein
MSSSEAEENTHRSQWRELARSLSQREILYFISGAPNGVRETKIKTFMNDVFKFSINGSIEPHLEKLESDGFLTKESTRGGAIVWHANQSLVIDMIQKELDELKHRENELCDLRAYLLGMYTD